MLRCAIPLCWLSALLMAVAQSPLDRWLDRQAQIQSIDTKFTQERQLPALKQPTTTQGRLSFVKPAMVRWQLGEPFQTLAVSDGENFMLLDATEKVARKVPVNSPQAARFSMLSGKGFESKESFYRAFEIIETRDSGAMHQVTLKPKDRKIRAEVPWIFLHIDTSKNELRMLEMELQDKSRVSTTFESPRFNVKLDPSLFHPDLSGYEVK